MTALLAVRTRIGCYCAPPWVPVFEAGEAHGSMPDPCLAGVEDTGALALAARAPGPELLAELTALQFHLGADLERRRRAEAEAAATAAPASRSWEGEPRSHTAEEVAARLRLSASEARVLVARAEALAGPRRSVLDALEVGEIAVPRAVHLVDALAALPEAVAGEVETAVLPGAGRTTRRALGQRVARAVQAAVPEGEARRARERSTQRRVTWSGEPDGQACLQVRGPAVEVTAIARATEPPGSPDPPVPCGG